MKTCPFCAEEIQDAAIVCKHCGRDLNRPQPGSASTPPRGLDSADYQRVFEKFDANGGSFAATWNWSAFLLGALWYVTKGMWAKAGLMVLVLILTAGVAFVPVWIYCGVAGNYDYYLLHRKGKQLW